jgi:hypothetical protein
MLDMLDLLLASSLILLESASFVSASSAKWNWQNLLTVWCVQSMSSGNNLCLLEGKGSILAAAITSLMKDGPSISEDRDV